MATSTMDPEKGLITATARSTIPSWASSSPEQHTMVSDPTTYTPLQLFQLLIGINTPKTISKEETTHLLGAVKDKTKKSRVDNVGLYQRAREQERTARIQYMCTSFISNTLYMLQILLAATFTALSAYKDSNPVTLTVLGAINTVLAGCLAWQKGQGVPQRYRKAADEYAALLLEIEQSERLFLDPQNSVDQGAKRDPRVEVNRLQQLFDTARANQQANYPDLYVSTTASTAAQTDLAKQLEDAKAESAKVQGELKAHIEELMAKVGNKVEAKVEAKVDDVIQTTAKA